MDDKVKIQVFIATYNRPELMFRSLNSVINQNFDSYEIIVSDNSTDNRTEEIIKETTEKIRMFRLNSSKILPLRTWL